MTKKKDAALMPVERSSQSILMLRSQRVLLDHRRRVGSFEIAVCDFK